MSNVNPRLTYWVKAVNACPDFTDAHVRILICLAVDCLDYGTGAGYCSEDMLFRRTGKKDRTIRDALKLAQKVGLIERTRRGHRLGNGGKIASEWQLIYPPMSPRRDVGSTSTGSSMPVGSSSTGSGVPVEDVSTGSRMHLNRQIPASQPAATCRPTGNEGTTGNEAPSTAHAREAGLVPVVAGTVVANRERGLDFPSHDNRGDEIPERVRAEVVRLLTHNPRIGSSAAVLKSQMADGTIWLTVEQARANVGRHDLLMEALAHGEADRELERQAEQARRETCQHSVTDPTRHQGYGAIPPQRPCGRRASHLNRTLQIGICPEHSASYPEITLTRLDDPEDSRPSWES